MAIPAGIHENISYLIGFYDSTPQYIAEIWIPNGNILFRNHQERKLAFESKFGLESDFPFIKHPIWTLCIKFNVIINNSHIALVFLYPYQNRVT